MNDTPKLQDLPGLKESELIKLGRCPLCQKSQLAGGVTFYKVEISRGVFDLNAVRRAAGLEMQIGALAQIMGPDENLARIFKGPKTVFVHEQCAHEINSLLILMGDDDERKGDG